MPRRALNDRRITQFTRTGLHAIIYLRTWRHGPECYEHCQASGYQSSVVYDPEGTRYDDVFAAVLRGEADLIVVWSMADLPPDRLPRVEAAEDLHPELDAHRRRPKVVRAQKQEPRPGRRGPERG